MNRPDTTRRTWLAASLAAAALPLCLATAAAAQTPAAAAATPGWPAKPLRIIVGFPPGSSPDLTARTFSEPLSHALGQPVIVENKVGAGGNIGADAVAKATDGHTIGLFINGNLTIARLINPQLPYDPRKDLAPLSLIGVSPLVLTAPASQPDVPAGADGRAFMEAARRAGDRWSYGTPGVGTVGHLVTELLKARAGIAPVHVPYPGYPQVATGMLGGQLQMALLPPALAVAQERTGKLRLIGVTSSGRSALVPGVPSMAAMSSRVTARRPCIRARALEASTRAWPARGPAPQPMCFFTASTVVSLGRVARTRRVA